MGLRFHNYSLLESGGMLFLDTILLLVLFFYLDQVHFFFVRHFGRYPVAGESPPVQDELSLL